MSEVPVPTDEKGMLGWLVATVGAQGKQLSTLFEELKEQRRERRDDIRILKVELVEEFERIEREMKARFERNEAVAVKQDVRIKVLEDARLGEHQFRLGWRSAVAGAVALGSVAAGWFGKQFAQ